MMKSLVLFLAIVAVTLAQETYPSTWDNIKLDEIFKNDRLVKNYVDCLLDKGKCTPDGATLKRLLPDALKTKCAKCTDKQKEGAAKIVEFMVKNKPELWKMLVAKYDPKGIYSNGAVLH